MAGFDIDLSQMIADELGVTLTILDMPFDTLISACNSSINDMIVAAMTYTESRAEILSPSINYISLSQVVIIRKNSTDFPTTIESLNNLTGFNVGVQSGTVMHDKLLNIPGVIVTVYFNAISLIQDLVNGVIQAAYIEEPIFTVWMQKENLRIIFGTDSWPLAIWCKYGEPELLSIINKVIFESYQNVKMLN
ncbi:MAG: substrate-binding periplasmic protein [Candidatus Thorarchaeota archaeon]